MNTRKLVMMVVVMVMSLMTLVGSASADSGKPQGQEGLNWQNPVGGLVPKPDLYIHSISFFQTPNGDWYTKIKVGNKGNYGTHVIAVKVTDAQGERVEYITSLAPAEVKQVVLRLRSNCLTAFADGYNWETEWNEFNNTATKCLN